MNTARKQIVREDLYPSRIEPHPVWIGRQDPVVHSQWRPNAPISETDSQSFARDGYLVLDGAFAPEEIAALEQELARLRAAPDALMRDTLVMEPDADDALRSIFSVHTQSALFRALAHDERLVAIARYLLGDEVYIHQSRLNYKPGFTGKEFYWHSDFETWHIEDGMPRMRALSMSLLLSENTANNGPLMLMPGSHMHYVACVGETPENHYKQSLRKQEYGVPDHESLAKLAKDGIAAPLGAPGSLVIFDCNTMHGSNGNITPLPRANAFIVFNAVSNAIGAPFGAVAPRPEFIA
ncbi:MAG: ectoine hydroxylase, partial [Hyphomonadaceae bacterium]